MVDQFRWKDIREISGMQSRFFNLFFPSQFPAAPLPQKLDWKREEHARKSVRVSSLLRFFSLPPPPPSFRPWRPGESKQLLLCTGLRTAEDFDLEREGNVNAISVNHAFTGRETGRKRTAGTSHSCCYWAANQRINATLISQDSAPLGVVSFGHSC